LNPIDQFFNENYNSLRDAAYRITGGDALSEELLHYAIDEFLIKKDVIAIIDSGGARFYCVKIMMTQWRSTSGPFFHTYRKASQDIEEAEDIPIEIDEIPETAKRITKALQKLNWYDKLLFETFVTEGHSISSLSRATGIPRTSISLSINRIRKWIKTQI
jgi:hypothetical protein